jgi:hypothetical protein
MSNREIRVSSAKLLESLLPQFDDLKSQHGFKSDGEVIQYLLNLQAQPKSVDGITFSNTHKPLGYQLTEKELVDFATQDLPIERLIHKGVLAEAKRIYSEKNNENRTRGNRTESLKKISDAVIKQMEINKQGDKSTQRYISSAWIQKETKCNFPAIQEYLAIHQDEVDAHNAECNIDENHNRSVLREAKRALKDKITTTTED